MEKERTRTLRPAQIRDGLTLTVYANEAEQNKIAVLIGQLPQRVCEWAVVAACTDPRNYARDLDDGIVGEAMIDWLTTFRDGTPLAIRTPGLYVSLRLDEDYLIAARELRGKRLESSDSEDDVRSGALQRALERPTACVGEPGNSVPHTSSLELTSFARQEDEDREADATEHASLGTAEDVEQKGSTEGMSCPWNALPRSRAVVHDVLNGQLGNSRATLAHLLSRLSNQPLGQPHTLTRAELAHLDAILEARLEEIERTRTSESQHVRVGKAIKYLQADDDLYEQLKNVRREQEASGPNYADILTAISDEPARRTPQPEHDEALERWLADDDPLPF